MTAPKRRLLSNHPYIAPTRRSPKEHTWDMDKNFSITRNLQRDEVILLHQGNIIAHLTVEEAMKRGEDIINNPLADDTQKRSGQMLCSAASDIRK